MALKYPFLKRGREYKTGLILSGGAARGFAHLGVLQAMHEHEIFPDVISCVSAGAIVGAFYADGYQPIEILRMFQAKSFYKYAEFVFRKTGLMRAHGLKDMLKKYLRATNFAELGKPLYVASTNLRTGKCEYIHSGNLVDAVLASSSIPVLFLPTKFNGQTYSDGGITDNFPVYPIKNNCKRIIGVHVNPIGEEEKLNSLLKIAVRTFHLSVASNLDDKLKYLDLFIEPDGLKSYGLLDVAKGTEIFDIGYHAAKETISKKWMNYRA